MFNFFKRKGGKAECAGNDPSANLAAAVARASRTTNDVTNENTGTIRKDVVNLLLPEIDYNQKTGVGAILQIMAGKRKRNKKKTVRAESCREAPNDVCVNLQRSKSDAEPIRSDAHDVAPAPAKNTRDDRHASDDPADFVKALVLQKYANKSPEQPKQHVSRIYVTGEPDLEEKRHAEALLREIARTIDVTIDKINENKIQMGNADSRTGKPDRKVEPVYATIDDNSKNTNVVNNPIESYKNDLKDELEKLRKSEDKQTEENEQDTQADNISLDSAFKKKSNLKVPRTEADGCSDDDRSDNGKKKVTFRKHIVFDDGDQQTDEEVDSSFESLISEEEMEDEEEDDDDEYLEDSVPDNDELLGGVVVSRSDSDRTSLNLIENNHSESQNQPVTIEVENSDQLKRISSDNSDSGFLEISDKQNESCDDLTCVKSMEAEDSSESDVSESEEVEEEIIEEIVEEEEYTDEEVAEEETEKEIDKKSLVSPDHKQLELPALTHLDARDVEHAREIVAACRKDIEERDKELAHLRTELAAAYKESELVRQRSRSLEEELSAARSCSADLAEQLQRRNDDALRQIQSELEDALNRTAELESRVLALERERDRLLEEKETQEQKAQEALEAAEATSTKWRLAHESARSQAATRAERIMADCEWKMRELEKRAREAEKNNRELTDTVTQLQSAPPPSPASLAELQQLRGIVSEQQRSLTSLSLQLQRADTKHAALQLELLRLQDLLQNRETAIKDEKERHQKEVENLKADHSKAISTLKSEHSTSTASMRATLERNFAEKTRAALAQLRAEADKDAKNADRKLREVTTRLENLKEVLATKESQFEHAIAEANSSADWNIMQLRHLLDKADITYANNVEAMTERFEKETERLNEEWSAKLEALEKEKTTEVEEARKLLEVTRSKLISEKNEQLHKLKEKHKEEMDDQWEQFMIDKENCLTRMKFECRQEGDEERVKREKELLEEIAELKAQIGSKSLDFDKLAVKAAACGRTLAVTEQELREALQRERELREKKSEDATKIKQVEKSAKEQVEHLQRKCACLRKLFDDMRNRLISRDETSKQELRAKDKEISQLKAEVARLTKMLVVQDTSKLGARTRADGCETVQNDETSKSDQPRRKGGTHRTPEPYRKRPTLPELTALPPETRRNSYEFQNGRKRANSVDLPAVQVPVRIKQLEEKNKE